MRDKATERWSTYEPFFIALGDKKVADIVITNHAKGRYGDRIESDGKSAEDIAAWLWECLKMKQIVSYYRNEEDVYLIDEDIVMVAEFGELAGPYPAEGGPLHKMIVVTFLGKMSETIELRDLKSYYSWLRHSRRMTLMKNGRKKK
ncbi:hypothetical protein QWJ34_06285 [Saccharibacillus sp. CPCC 101409]|uniref:hypothetical protein n=1 Tax=Saccharibacillus sp. CPCC 101409 TaxID=3058041 RepID=UPI0026735113|nr:hypothetical protein [Saccharibacillus sp. CPCC 101409]MDO3409364.1 hypothetical protein [Saccharibacillus sp. CPCC 101409]